MAWRTITADDVRGALSAPELAAYNTAAIGSGQDPLADITGTAVHEARAHIADCAANTLPTGNTVPDRVVHHLLAIIRFRMLTRLDLDVSDARKMEYNEAKKFFIRVAECKVSIEQPDGGAIEESSAPQTETLVSPTRIATRDKLSGL